MRTLAIVIGVVALVGGFGTYLAFQLQQHGAECDSALRHCAVTRDEIAFLEGDWCLAAAPETLRESVRFEPERILATQSGSRIGTPREVELRVFRSMGALVYFEHAPGSGERLSTELGLARTGEDTRQTSLGPNRADWVRC